MKLDQIAAMMRQDLAAGDGYRQHLLFGGLAILLEHRGEMWRLAIAREKVWPSDTEIATISRCFGLGQDLSWRRVQKKQDRRQVSNGCVRAWKVIWNVAETTWREEVKHEG